MKQTIREKIINLFNVFIPTGTSDKMVIRELDRRGKLDIKKLTEMIFILVEEVESLKPKK